MHLIVFHGADGSHFVVETVIQRRLPESVLTSVTTLEDAADHLRQVFLRRETCDAIVMDWELVCCYESPEDIRQFFQVLYVRKQQPYFAVIHRGRDDRAASVIEAMLKEYDGTGDAWNMADMAADDYRDFFGKLQTYAMEMARA